MSTETDSLGLFKYDTIENAEDKFNIDKALNENWDIIDRRFAISKYLKDITYKKDDFVIECIDDTEALYRSLVDNNLGNSLSDENYWKEVSLGGGSGFEVGDIGQSVFPIDENNMTRRYLNGSWMDYTIYGEAGEYFLDKIKKTAESYPSLICSEEEWDSIAKKSAFAQFNDNNECISLGQCGKFVIDEKNHRIKLPKIIMPIQSLKDLTNLGELVEQSLPNIKGTLYEIDKECGVSGAFTRKAVDKAGWRNEDEGGYKVTFNANSSNKIYKDGANIQPEQVQYPYFIQVACDSKKKAVSFIEQELNCPFTLLECKYSPIELNNLSWLKSVGQWNSGDVYVDAYELLLSVYNGKIIKGMKVKTVTETYNDLDFVINTEDRTFRLPLTANTYGEVGKRFLVESVQNDNGWYNLYSDGWLEQGGKSSKNKNYDNIIFLKEFRNAEEILITTGESNGVASSTDKDGAANTAFISNMTNTGFRVSQSKGTNRCVNWKAVGYAVSVPLLENYVDNLNLYYYIGDTVQNASLINIGRITEQLIGTIEKETALDIMSDLAKVEDIPTKVSELENDNGYLTEENCYNKESIDTLLNEKVDSDVLTEYYVSKVDIENAEYITSAELDNFIEANVVTPETLENVIKKELEFIVNISDLEENYYNKLEIDSKLASIYNFKGSVASYEDLPTNNKVGDVYNILSSGANYAWTEDGWDKLSETIDLSSYALKSEIPTDEYINNLIDSKLTEDYVKSYFNNLIETKLGEIENDTY